MLALGMQHMLQRRFELVMASIFTGPGRDHQHRFYSMGSCFGPSSANIFCMILANLEYSTHDLAMKADGADTALHHGKKSGVPRLRQQFNPPKGATTKHARSSWHRNHFK